MRGRKKRRRRKIDLNELQLHIKRKTTLMLTSKYEVAMPPILDEGRMLENKAMNY